jgi:hypothetical protein
LISFSLDLLDPVKLAMLVAALVFGCSSQASPKDAKNIPNLSGDYSRVPNEWDTSFHLSIQQRGAQVELSFMGTLRGGKGRPIEGSGTGSVSSAGVLTFTFQDPFGNSGSGTFKKSGKQFLLSIDPTEIKEPGLMPFYGIFRMTRDRLQ